MMTAEELQRVGEVCQRYGVARLDVFGSAVRGSAAAGSDLDLLYTLAEGARLGWEIDDLTTELEAIVGRPVDLVAPAALHPLIRGHVLDEARPFYVAA